MRIDRSRAGPAADRVAVPYHDDVSFSPRNFIRAAALLLVAERPDHGYGLVERLGAMGVADGNPGAVYRTLRALERAGLLRSRWADSPAGPPKRVYVVTPAGHEALAAWTAALHKECDLLTAYLRRHARQHPEPAARTG